LTGPERETYRRYARLALPRHTSYPIAAVWKPDYGPRELAEDLEQARQEDRPLSLYVHVPFCESLCYSCACTKEIVTPKQHRNADPGEALLAGLEREADHFVHAAGAREVRQVHLGGGSPTFLHPEQLDRLGRLLQARFPIAPDAEISAEIDPRITTFEHLETLRRLGFNRLSLGVQDFDQRVQKAVHRVQPFEVVERCVRQARALGFGSINFDLLYGLPFQTIGSMADTLEKTVALAPDRIAFYRLAVLPEMFRWQRAFRPDDLPAGDLPLELNLLAVNRFLAAGYEFIGLDHFARPDEGLARARREGSLRRSFQGMTTGRALDLLGLGPSAITELDRAYSQNAKTTSGWNQATALGLATERGLRLVTEDRLRREALQQLYCHGVIEGETLGRSFGIDFHEHFRVEQEALARLSEEGLVEIEGGTVRLTEPLGRLLVRVVAAVFDRYLPPDAYRNGLPAQQSSRVG
jgi:oxygen-independent coproporphyrinogen-3 oxidase